MSIPLVKSLYLLALACLICLFCTYVSAGNKEFVRALIVHRAPILMANKMLLFCTRFYTFVFFNMSSFNKLSLLLFKHSAMHNMLLQIMYTICRHSAATACDALFRKNVMALIRAVVWWVVVAAVHSGVDAFSRRSRTECGLDA